MRASKEIRRAVKHLTIAAGDVENLEAEIRTLKAKAAEVVVELRVMQKTAKHMSSTLPENLVAEIKHAGAAIAFANAADLVASKLGVKS